MTKHADFWTGIVLALLGAGLLALTSQVQLTETNLIGARFVPQVVSGLLIVGGVMLALFWRVADATPTDAVQATPMVEAAPHALPTALALPLIGALYTFAIPQVGYIAATFLGAAAALMLYGARKPLRILLAATVMATLMHLIFVVLMGIFLPRGQFFDILNWLG